VPVSLVTIGIPAYNRPDGLERATRSALAQDHSELEVLLSDDASTDRAVEEVASGLASGDPRVRLVRQPRNLGHAGNYQWLLEAARGEYFMWLADDDWIDPGYVGSCVAALRGNPGTLLVCGLARYYRDGEYLFDERAIDLTADRAGVRLVRYFARVSLNGALFGVARREDLLPVGFPGVVGGDWMLIAALAARGRIRTLAQVHVHRSVSGLGSEPTRLAHSFGMRGRAADRHHAIVAARMWREIAFGAVAPEGTSAVARLSVGSVVAALIVARFTLADFARGVLGEQAAASLERRISAWLRARDQGTAR
jgi:hypothetical protein